MALKLLEGTATHSRAPSIELDADVAQLQGVRDDPLGGVALSPELSPTREVPE